jgi:hypothetical protein
MRSGGVPCCTNQRKRLRISSVLPLPAEPRTSSGLPLWLTTVACSWRMDVDASRTWSDSIGSQWAILDR